jgi:hypothetical protein
MTIEYAQTYNTAERIRFAALGVVLGALAVGAGKFWFLPWLGRFAATAPCSTVLGINGATVLGYSLFVALPLLGAIVVGLSVGRSGLITLRESQFPPPGTKVFRPTRIRRGAAARRVGYLRLAAFTPFLALALWGYIQATHLSDLRGATKCTANKAFNSDPPRGSA